MRKVRDFDAELKALNDRAKLLKQRKVQQFGELIEVTRADTLEPDLLAGALLAAVGEKDKSITAKWSARGAQFFRDTSRRSSRSTGGSGGSGTAAETGSEPA